MQKYSMIDCLSWKDHYKHVMFGFYSDKIKKLYLISSIMRVIGERGGDMEKSNQLKSYWPQIKDHSILSNIWTYSPFPKSFLHP